MLRSHKLTSTCCRCNSLPSTAPAKHILPSWFAHSRPEQYIFNTCPLPRQRECHPFRGNCINRSAASTTDVYHQIPIREKWELKIVLQANGKHIFAAVLTQSRVARGAFYLRQHLYMELLDQLNKLKGDLHSALRIALDTLNKDFQNLHPANHHILEGVELAAAFLEFKTGKLYIASNGNCRCVLLIACYTEVTAVCIPESNRDLGIWLIPA